MSTYEYKCRDCGFRFEKMLTMTEHDKLDPPCPKCKSTNVEHLLSMFAARTDSKTWVAVTKRFFFKTEYDSGTC